MGNYIIKKGVCEREEKGRKSRYSMRRETQEKEP